MLTAGFQQLHEGFELEPGDVRPATVLLHGLQQLVELLAIGGQAAAERPVL